VATTAATPIGMFTNRTQRHDSAEVSTPPRSSLPPPCPGDGAPDAEARALRSAEKVVMMIVSVAGDKMAPAMPCTARAAVSSAEFVAMPPARLPR